MELNHSTVEQVTALTNLPLVLTSLVAVACLWRRQQAHPLRAWLWIGMFSGLAIASGMGVFAHGLALEPVARKLIWHPIRAALGLTVACFVAGAVLDRWGRVTAVRTLPVMLLLSASFFGYTSFVASSFLPFILYEGLAMLFCLAIYLTLAVQRRLAGAGWMVAGVGITIFAALVQAMPVALRFGVSIDHNGLYHLVQLPGLFCLLTGVQIGLGSKPVNEANAVGTFPDLSISDERSGYAQLPCARAG